MADERITMSDAEVLRIARDIATGSASEADIQRAHAFERQELGLELEDE